MKKIFLSTFVLFYITASSLFGQTSYLQVIYPWLSFKVVQDKKVKKLTRAIMDSNNGSVSHFQIIEFDANARPVIETLTGDNGLTTYFYYNDAGLLHMIKYQQPDRSEIVDSFYYNKSTKILSSIRYSNGWYRDDLQFDIADKVVSIASYTSDTENAPPFSSDLWVLADKIPITYDDAQHTINLSNADFSTTFYYSADGQLIKYVTVNNLYGITEISENAFDQNGLQVKCEVSQDGVVIETSFITYEFY